MAIAIIHIGLPLDHSLIPVDQRAELIQRLAKLRRRMVDAGYAYEIFHASPETGLEAFKAKLKSKRFDGVFLGGGVVGNPELAGFQQQIIEAVHEAAPLATVMLHDHAEDVADTIRRCLGEPTR